MTYSAENAAAKDVSEDVKELERKLVPHPTSKSYIECTICMDACPVGKSKASTDS
jgi:NAD-dependent dihydropyrimidine dehydrogenase PreA subunit